MENTNITVNISIPHNRFMCADEKTEHIYILPLNMYETARKLGVNRQSKRFGLTARKYSTTITKYVEHMWSDDNLSRKLIVQNGSELYSTEYFSDGMWFGMDIDGIFIAEIKYTE